MNSLATLLTALDYKVWLSWMVILITVCSNILQYQMVQQRLNSHNGAIHNLQGVEAFMAGLSVVQRRTQKTKAMCVTMTETVVLETVQAWAGITAKVANSASSNEGDEKKEKNE